MNIKQQFIIALIFVCTFLAVSAFMIIYGIISNTATWDAFQPYFTGFIGPVSMILGYYFKSITDKS